MARYTDNIVVKLLNAWPYVLVVLAGSLQIQGIDGAVLRPLEPAGAAQVLFFVATDCPISNSYAPEIQRICSAYAAKGISCALIYEDLDVTAQDVRKHLEEYRYQGISAAIDRDGSLAAKVGASITPEAAAVDRHGAVRYRGRIDNFYQDLGRPRQVVTARDLRDALDAILAGRAGPAIETQAVGCYIVPSHMRRK